MKLKIFLSIFTSFLILYSCTKEEFILDKEDSFITSKEDSLYEKSSTSCPEETVHYTDLADETIDPGTSGQLHDVYRYCYGHLTCTFIDLDTIDLDSCREIDDLVSGTWSPPNVTYAQQREIIDYYLDIADDYRPNCTGGSPKEIVDLLFKRYPSPLTDWICVSVVYGCCGTGGS